MISHASSAITTIEEKGVDDDGGVAEFSGTRAGRIKKRQSVFRLAVLGLVRGLDEVVAGSDLVLVCEVNASDVHGDVFDEVPVFLDEQPVVIFMLFLQGVGLDDLLDLLDLGGLVSQVDHVFGGRC